MTPPTHAELGESLISTPPRRPVVALGYQGSDGIIIVTDVLCMNFPEITDKELARLSFKLDQWSREFRR